MLFGWLFILLAIALEISVIYYLARGPRKRFLFVLIFCIIQILVVATDTFFSSAIGPRTRLYAAVYWTGDLIAHAAISLLTISLIWQSLETHHSRRKTIAALTAAMLAFALFSVFIFQDRNFNRWMTLVSRNLSFGEEVLNLLLWAILIQRGDSDYLLLMVSAGIGVQVTGEAIGHTLRLYTHSRATVWVPTLLVQMAEILCLAIWIWAFRTERTMQAKPVTSHSSPRRDRVRLG